MQSLKPKTSLRRSSDILCTKPLHAYLIYWLLNYVMQYVDRGFGTGALKITPGHDPNDYAIGKKLGLPTINILNNDGTLNDNAGAYRYFCFPFRRLHSI